MQFIDKKQYDINDGQSTIRFTYDEKTNSFQPPVSYFSGYYRLQPIFADVAIASGCLEIKEVE